MPDQTDKGPLNKGQATKVPPRQKGGGQKGGGQKGAGQKGAVNRGAAQKGAAPPRPSNTRPPRRGRRGRSHRLIFGGTGLIGVVLIAVVVILVSTGGGSSNKVATKQPAINYTLSNGTKVYGKLGPENVPLEVGPQLGPANTGLTGQPIDGVQCNSSEQLAYHHHIHLSIFINGTPRSVPLGVGMVPPAEVQQSAQGDFAVGSATCLYWTHVHAQDGIIHLESPLAKNFELGQIFGIWHQPLSSTQIGPYKGHVTATVNGQPWTGDPSQIALTEHAEVVLNLGGPVISPPPISWSGTGL